MLVKAAFSSTALPSPGKSETTVNQSHGIFSMREINIRTSARNYQRSDCDGALYVLEGSTQAGNGQANAEKFFDLMERIAAF
jgi:hypothetical protein